MGRTHIAKAAGAAITLPPGCVLGAIGLVLPEGLSLQEWVSAGTTLGPWWTQLTWAIGDWWAAAQRYGYAMPMLDPGWNGPSLQTCENCHLVCRAFETSRRREGLSFKHHATVAGLAPGNADELLQWCIDTGKPNRPRSIAALREEIRRRVVEELARLAASVKIGTGNPSTTIKISMQFEAAIKELIESLIGRVPPPWAAATQKTDNIIALPLVGTKPPRPAAPAPAATFAADVAMVGDAIAAALDVVDLPKRVRAKLEAAQPTLAKLSAAGGADAKLVN